MTTGKYASRPPRLPIVFQKYDHALYFVTFNTYDRRPLLACEVVHRSFKGFAEVGLQKGIAVGRYVIMPDHVHFFMRNTSNLTLGRYVGMVKQHISKKALMQQSMPHWQEGAFDHLLRDNERYAEKWAYVRNNPVRKGLVNKPEDWPYQGEIVTIDRI